jgi:GNAT superfamily N-acetyltransferase
MNTFTIRKAEGHDLRAINRIIESAVMNWPTQKRLKQLAVRPLQYDEVDLAQYEVLVAEVHGEVVGVAVWDAEAATLLPNGEGGLLHGLYVLPLFQRQGVGRKLMEAVFAVAAERNLPGLLIKAQRVSRSYFEHQGLELRAANEDEYPWQYWKRLS